ncbi:hypothetical protein A9Q99_13280 [Gammaproteobacteria bacterium 45_16_T64]|nr:hypothetical protein A9Q99_13280 [Gammaproteobacteria bacterium 45_16_T64]
MSNGISYQDWHIAWADDQISLKDGLDRMLKIGAPEEEIPLLIKLVENPKFSIPGITLFHGAVELKQHDCIHVLLGRGLLPKDEAFVIGFTMGSTNQVSTAEESMFCKITKHLYPRIYKFNDEEISIFKDAVRLGTISDCKPLDCFDFESWQHKPLADIRIAAGIEPELIEAYYQVEKRRFPNSKASQRL